MRAIRNYLLAVILFELVLFMMLIVVHAYAGATMIGLIIVGLLFALFKNRLYLIGG